MRRIETWLVIVVVLVAAVWGLLWWLVSGYVEQSVGEALAASAEGGVEIACEESGRRGFPFRLEVVCSGVSARATDGAWNASLERFQAGTLVRSPRNIDATLQGPLQFDLAALDRSVTAEWASARAEAYVGDDGPRSLSLRLFSASAASGDYRLAAHQARLDVAPAEDGGSLLVFAGEQLRLALGELALPQADLRAEALTPIPAEALLAGDVELVEGFSVSDLSLRLETPQVQAFAEGDIEVDPEGLASGSLTLHLVGVERLPVLFEGLPADARSAANVATGALMALAAPAEWQGRPARRVVLTLTQGEVRAGPLSLGRLPPLWQAPPSS